MKDCNRVAPEQNISQDSLFDGDLIICQNRNGYRFSIDSVLLAHFLNPQHGDRILDMGTGCGVICMILLYRWASRVREVSGIEIQSSLVKLAKLNYASNGFQNNGQIIQADIRNILNVIEPESYDKIVCNPPFYPCDTGRMNKNKEENLARHHVLGSLSDFLMASATAVKNRGEVFFIYPAESVADFIIAARNVRLEVKKIRFVYSYPHQTNSSQLALFQCKKNGGSNTVILPPLYIYNYKNGPFSAEMLNHYQSKSAKSS